VLSLLTYSKVISPNCLRDSLEVILIPEAASASGWFGVIKRAIAKALKAVLGVDNYHRVAIFSQGSDCGNDTIGDDTGFVVRDNDGVETIDWPC
jgi:hypothetical protein